jgi:hypothetical protein
MDDSQANNSMSDNLAERLKNLAQEHEHRTQAKIDQQRSRERADAFVSAHARNEYDNLVRLLKERAEQMNSNIGNLPEFVPGGSRIELGHMALYHFFDQPVVNRPDNVLELTIGTAPHKMYLSGSEPTPVKYKFVAMASVDLSSIVWVGNGRQFTSAQLVDFVLEKFVATYLQQARK